MRISQHLRISQRSRTGGPWGADALGRWRGLTARGVTPRAQAPLPGSKLFQDTTRLLLDREASIAALQTRVDAHAAEVRAPLPLSTPARRPVPGERASQAAASSAGRFA
mgnify:FL=1